MSAYPTQTETSRAPGPAPFAAGDGMEPGAVYTALIASTPVGMAVEVTIPALSATMRYGAKIGPGQLAVRGQTALVVFDNTKTPWVIVGSWEAPTGWESGDLKWSADTTPGVGWIGPCLGGEVLASEYPALAAKLGTGETSYYGPARAGYIKLPDGRVTPLRTPE